MRRPAYHRDRSGFDATMTPMIDVVFLLLVFFVWTASFQLVESVLPSNVAQAAGQSAEVVLDPIELDVERIVLRGSWDGQAARWTINERPTGSLAEVRGLMAALRDQMGALGSDMTALPVIVDPAAGVPMGDVIDVYDVCRLEGYLKIQFAAEKPRIGARGEGARGE